MQTPKTRISDEVFQKIRDNLANGVWGAGSRLPSENQLAHMYSVSRVTIRAALQKLDALGLIRTINGKGSYAQPPPDPAPICMSDVLKLRRSLEKLACTLVADQISLRSEDELSRQLPGIVQALASGSANVVYESDIAFHQTLAAQTGNTLLISFLGEIYDYMLNQYKATGGHYAPAPLYYERLVAALRTRDVKTAKKIIERNLDAVDQYFQSVFA